MGHPVGYIYLLIRVLRDVKPFIYTFQPVSEFPESFMSLDGEKIPSGRIKFLFLLNIETFFHVYQ